MSINRILIATMTVCGIAASGAAFAVAPPIAAGAVFNVSGSTALDNQLKDTYLLDTTAGGPCAAGTIDVYVDGTSLTKSTHQTVVACNLAVAIGSLTVGTPVAFTKESNGGSNEGTFPIASQLANQKFLDATLAITGCAAGVAKAAGAYFPHQQAFTEHDGCTGPIISTIPTAGVADENPAVFNIGNIVTPALQANLNTAPLFQNVFGIGVTLNLYRALQRAQGKALDDTLANMPSLSKQQIAQLLTGNSKSWTSITDAAGKAINSSTTPNYTNGVAVSNTVYLCRRGDASGTNVSADIYFLRNRCEKGLAPMRKVTTAATTTACKGLIDSPENSGCAYQAAGLANATPNNLSDLVFAGFSGGDLVNCLHDHDIHDQFAFGPLGITSNFDDPNGLGGSADTTGTNHFRYIAIDGKKPTVIALANGQYDYAFDNVLNTWTGLTGDPAAFATFLQTALTNETVISDLITVQPNAGDPNFAVGGLLDVTNPNGVLQNVPPVSLSQLNSATGNAVSAFTFSTSGSVNDCQPPIPVGPVLTLP